MQFKRTDELKAGMRLARPIYNRNGVLLYERNSKLTLQSIMSIRNFGLIGIFVLEPAEPVPPMTMDDIEFERFQTMSVLAIQEETQSILQNKKINKMQVIAGTIIKNYGRLNKKINFIQNLRSKADQAYKHSLNVAILCAMIAHKMKVRAEEQLDTVIAGIVHELGKPDYGLLDIVFDANPNIKRICAQCDKLLSDLENKEHSDRKVMSGAKILMVADTYDTMTAMHLEKEPASEVRVLQYMMENSQYFDEAALNALISSIYILRPGTSVELNTGEKCLVLTENPENVLRPTLLAFKDNRIIDLSNRRANGNLWVRDIMKTMDNRYIMDVEALKKQGFQVEDEPEFVEVGEEKKRSDFHRQ